MRVKDQRKRQGVPRSFKRRVHFGNEEWAYKVGGMWVVVLAPDRKTTYRVRLEEVTGMSWDDIEKGRWKGWWQGVGPQEVRDYIERHLRGAPEIGVPPEVFLHPMEGISVTWHSSPDCNFLPQTRRGQLFDAIALDPSAAAVRLGQPLTRHNLCGVCMRRSLETETP